MCAGVRMMMCVCLRVCVGVCAVLACVRVCDCVYVWCVCESTSVRVMCLWVWCVCDSSSMRLLMCLCVHVRVCVSVSAM